MEQEKKATAQLRAKPTLRATLVRANGERVELGIIGSQQAAAQLDAELEQRRRAERDRRGH